MKDKENIMENKMIGVMNYIDCLELDNKELKNQVFNLEQTIISLQNELIDKDIEINDLKIKMYERNID